MQKDILSNPVTEEKRAKFIRKYMFKDDGHAAERISNEIIQLLEKNHKI